VEDDSGVVAGGGSAKGSLMADGNSVDDLRYVSGGRCEEIVIGGKHLVMTDDFSRGGAAVHHECMAESGTCQIRGMAEKGQSGTNLSRPSPTAMSRLLSPSQARSFLIYDHFNRGYQHTYMTDHSHASREDLVLCLERLVFADDIPYPD
jgi:hypothetical protein